MFQKYVLTGLLVLVAMRFGFAWATGTLTPAQMNYSFPYAKSTLPLLFHYGAWGSIPLAFLLAYLVQEHAMEWDAMTCILAIIIGIVGGGLMMWMYAHGPIPEADKEFPVGLCLFLYMVVAIAIAVLEYFGTAAPSSSELWWVTGFLTLYVALGNHFLLQVFRPLCYNENPLYSPIGWATVLIVGAFLSVVTVVRGT